MQSISGNKKNFYVVVSHEENKTAQIPNSDTSLHIPEGLDGLFMIRVLTDDPIFTDFNRIPQDDCFVSAVVEVLHSRFNIQRPDIIHTLKIPYCLPEQDRGQFFKIRQWAGDGYRELQQFEIPKVHEGCFYVNEHFITIYTRTFSKFTCTICKNVCQFRHHAFLCGKLHFWKGLNETTVKMICYISTYLTSLREFRKVGMLFSLDSNITCRLHFYF